MSSTTSVRTMVLQLSGMEDTTDLSDWENDFLKNILRQTNNGARTSGLSEKQIERVELLWRKHFAG